AGDVVEGAAGGVGGDDGGGGRFEGVPERLVGDVGDVDHHAEAVHFANDVFAEIGEAVVFGGMAGGIGPGGGGGVGEGDVADAEGVVGAEHGEVGIDGVAAFEAHEHGDAAAFAGIDEVGGGGGHDEGFGVAGDFAVDGVDLLEGAADGFGGGEAVGIGP